MAVIRENMTESGHLAPYVGELKCALIAFLFILVKQIIYIKLIIITSKYIYQNLLSLISLFLH